MLTSRFDLCKPEWLELVFAKRNKEYGAYYLRQHYADNVNKAMGITFFSVISIFLVLGVVVRSKPALFTNTVVTITPYVAPPVPPKTEPVHKAAKAAAPKAMVPTTKFVTPVVVSTPVPVEPPKISAMTGEVGPVDITAPATTGTVGINDGKDSGVGTVADDPNKIYNTKGLEVEPEPYGGAAAWTKFLQKNLRYPGEAMDKQMSGKVWVTFIVEKNGHISSLVVTKGAGYGMDEEALRVLKLAPPWKPGQQNGQPVRVKYTLPLNFVMTEN